MPHTKWVPYVFHSLPRARLCQSWPGLSDCLHLTSESLSTEQRRVRLAARERIRATSMCVRVGRARRRPATREYSIAEGTATHYHGHSNQGSHARWVGVLHHTTPFCISINQSTVSVRTTDISKATQLCVCVWLEHDGARSRHRWRARA